MTKIYNQDGDNTPNPTPTEPTEPQEDKGPLTTPWGVGKGV